jgi:hypothetical protein
MENKEYMNLLAENADIYKANWDSITMLIFDKLRRANPMTKLSDIMDHINDSYSKYLDEHGYDAPDSVDEALELYDSLSEEFDNADPYNYTDQGVLCYRILDILGYIIEETDKNVCKKEGDENEMHDEDLEEEGFTPDDFSDPSEYEELTGEEWY